MKILALPAPSQLAFGLLGVLSFIGFAGADPSLSSARLTLGADSAGMGTCKVDGPIESAIPDGAERQQKNELVAFLNSL